MRRLAIVMLLPWTFLSWTPVLRAARQATLPPPNPADMKEFYNYALSMDKIRRLAAAEKDLDALQKSNPSLQQSLENDNSAANLDQAAQRLQKHPAKRSP